MYKQPLGVHRGFFVERKEVEWVVLRRSEGSGGRVIRLKTYLDLDISYRIRGGTCPDEMRKAKSTQFGAWGTSSGWWRISFSGGCFARAYRIMALFIFLCPFWDFLRQGPYNARVCWFNSLIFYMSLQLLRELRLPSFQFLYACFDNADIRE